MVDHMRENTLMIKNMVLVFIPGLIKDSTKAGGIKGNSMD
jgi:hypothetical protein